MFACQSRFLYVTRAIVSRAVQCLSRYDMPLVDRGVKCEDADSTMGGSHSEGTTSKVNVFANILISFVGSGILGLPYAFREAGVIEGIIIMAFVGILSIRAMLLLLDCKEKILSMPPSKTAIEEGQNGHIVAREASIDYGEVGFVAIGHPGRVIVEAAVIISQIGFCCAYLIFIPENLVSIFNTVPPFSELTKFHYLLMMVPPLMMLCNLRQLKYLGPFSLVAQMANLFAFMVVLWFDLKHTSTVNLDVKTVSLDGLPFFTGIAIYCFEGAGLVLSLEGSTEGDVKAGFKRLFTVALTVITSLYILFGVGGYMSFADLTEPMITLNLPPGLFPKFVISCLCYSLFFTYPVMMFPVSRILEKRLCFSANKGILSLNVKGTILRIVLILISVLVVLIIPNFSILMALVGSGCCTLLAFILPAVFHWKLFAEDSNTLGKSTDALLIVVGVIGTFIGLQDAIARLHAVHTGNA